MREIWFVIGACANPAIVRDSMHIEFFNSEQEARKRVSEYVFIYGTGYMGKVPKENL